MESQINLQNQNANSIYDSNQAQIKIVVKRKCILGDDVVIAADNIKKIGELIALLTIRTVMCRSGKDLYRLYDGPINDCNKSNDSLDKYSDGYDIAQTAMLFLCEHIGKRLGDNYTTAHGESTNDYTAVDALIERMNLTQGEYDVLCAYMSGLTYLEITRLLNVNRTTIWRIRTRIQEKYYLLENIRFLI